MGWQDAPIVGNSTTPKNAWESAPIVKGAITEMRAIKGKPTENPKPLWQYDTDQEQNIHDMSDLKAGIIGVGKGISDIYTGAKQRLAEVGNAIGIVSPDTVKNLQDEVASSRADFKPLAKVKPAAETGETIGQVAPTLLIPGGVQGGALARVGTSLLAGAAVGALQPTTKDESVIGNMVKGGVTAGATSGVLSGLGKTFNTIMGNVPKNEVTALSEKFKIPTTLGEVTGNPKIQKAETLLEEIPLVGISGFRKKQNEAAKVASKNFLAKYIVDPAADDAAIVNRAFVSAQYESLKDLVSTVTKQEIAPTETKNIARDLLGRYPDIFKKLQDTKTEGIILDIAKGTKDASIPYDMVKSTDILPKTLTFDEAWILRQGLGEKIGQARKLLARGEIDNTAYSQIKSLFSAVTNDLENWGKAIGKPEIFQAFQSANNAYKDYVVKYDIIQRAYDKASGEVGAGEIFSPKKFSTALKLTAYKDKALKNFSPSDIDEMTGLANILQVTKRAGQYMENPPTGHRWSSLIAGGLAEGAAYSAGGVPAVIDTAAVILTTGAIVKTLTTTEIGKKLILSASKVEPTSPVMRNIMIQLYNQLPKAAAVKDPFGLRGEVKSELTED